MSLLYPDKHMKHNQIDHENLGYPASDSVQHLDHDKKLPICPFAKWDRVGMPCRCRKQWSISTEHHHSAWHLWFHRHAHVIRREGYRSCFPSILPINQEGRLCFLLTSLHVGIKNLQS